MQNLVTQRSAISFGKNLNVIRETLHRLLKCDAIQWNVLVDSGCENINPEVNNLLDSELISRTFAQIDIEQSNSMIEMLFHRMKHRYLFIIFLANFESLVKGTDFCLEESNTSIPHSALKGLLRKKS